MSADRVLGLLDAAATADVAVWLDGGWGVDALLGAQHREHDDADLVVELGDIQLLLAAFAGHGVEVVENHLPTRLVLRTASEEQVDLHPVTFDDDGHGWQAHAAPDGSDCVYPADQFVHGVIEGRRVPCVGPGAQVEHHGGYKPRPHDVEDMLRLTEGFGLAMPEGYSDE